MAHGESSESPAIPTEHTFRIALLGTPTVTYAEKPVEITRRQTRALFYRLAAERGPVARAHLCYLFWPEVADDTARRNLTRLLVLLRASLPIPSLLLTDNETIDLDRECIWNDTAVFMAHMAESTPSTRRKALKQSLEFVRGPFLDGFSLPSAPEFEEWMDVERRVWERRVLDALSYLIEAHAAAHEFTDAIAAAQRYLRIDEFAEDVHRKLIALYAAVGDRPAALRQYERCAILLEREMGVAPIPETRAVYEAVRDGQEAFLKPLGAGTATEIQVFTASASPEIISTLPSITTLLVGRTAEILEAVSLLGRDEVRALTLSGPGGVGKTRLAIEIAGAIAARFADGVIFVPLAPLRDAALVVPTILNTLGLPDQGDRSPLLRLKDFLRQRAMLLVLDNFEHVVESAPEIAALLASAPNLKILVTSRALLHIAGEHNFAVLPLPLADLNRLPSLDELAKVDAIALFLARVRMRTPDFQFTSQNAFQIAAICARLDGLPLAIELAAARAPLLSPRMLLARLNHRLPLLTDGPRDLPERQRTLRATIDWSYRLLDLGEQLLAERLSVFSGGWHLEAAEALCDAVGPLSTGTFTVLHALLDKCLVQRVASDDGEPRFAMLETIREYTLERLTERGESRSVQDAHAQYYLALAESAATGAHGPDQIALFDIMEKEHDNMRVALGWLLDEKRVADALRLGGALMWFWFARGHLTEGRRWIERALALVEEEPLEREGFAPIVLARAIYGAGHLAAFQGDLDFARAHLEESITMCRLIESRDARLLEHNALLFLIVTTAWQGDIEAVEHASAAYYALVRTIDEPWTNAVAAFNYGRNILHHHDDIPNASANLLEAERLLRAVGDIGFLTQALIDLGTVALHTGDTEAARGHFEEALAASIAMKDSMTEAYVHNNLGEVGRMVGDYVNAGRHYTTSLRMLRDLDTKNEISRLLHNLGYIALHAGDVLLARNRFVESLIGLRAIGQVHGMAELIAGMACVHAYERTEESARLASRYWGAAGEVHALRRAHFWPPDRVEHARYQALARELIGAEAYDVAYAEGARLDPEVVIEEILST